MAMGLAGPATLPVQPLLHAVATLELTRFTVHWSTVIGLAALAGVYEWAARRAPEGTRLSRRDRATFYGGLLVIFGSLNGWLHDMSDAYLFSAHMVQHLLLTLLAPPLLIAGTPGWMLRPALRIGWVRATATRVSRATWGFVIFNLTIAIWHLPMVYAQAMQYHAVHIIQHLCFMVAAVLMWWPLLSPLPELPRLSFPLQMLYCFVMTIPMSIISVYIVYADKLLYTAYGFAPRLWGLSPMQDQLIGGLIMWIPGGLFFYVLLSIVFWKWQAAGAEDTAEAAQVGYHPAPR
ncbi:MAG: cytochrome c oxidase assembly protein [Gemmatimonadaceae bacterium]